MSEILNDPTLKSGEGRIILTSDKDHIDDYPLSPSIWFPFIKSHYLDTSSLSKKWADLNEQVRESKSCYDVM